MVCMSINTLKKPTALPKACSRNQDSSRTCSQGNSTVLELLLSSSTIILELFWNILSNKSRTFAEQYLDLSVF